MGFVPRAKPGWMLNARHERSENELPQTSYYTVLTQERGFPICFLCLHCNKVHCFPENPKEADFRDPGEASSYFKATFSVLANWEYELLEIFLLRVYRNG